MTFWAPKITIQLTPSSSTRQQWHFMMVQITINNSFRIWNNEPVPWVCIERRWGHQLSVKKFCGVFFCDILLRSNNNLTNGKYVHHCKGWERHSLLMVSWFSGWLYLQVVLARFITSSFCWMLVMFWFVFKSPNIRYKLALFRSLILSSTWPLSILFATMSIELTKSSP